MKKTRPLFLLFYVTQIILSFDCKAQSYSGELKNKVLAWNRAHNTHSSSELLALYKDQVFFYGLELSAQDCIDRKNDMYNENPDYQQLIYGDINVEGLSSNKVKCVFTKRVTFNEKTRDYPSYLIFEKTRDGWKISTEGDEVTDKNLAKIERPSHIPKDAIQGDYNGDGKKEYMWLELPVIIEDEMDCKGACDSYVCFSDPSIPRIKVANCIGGGLHNYGDLNGNHTDEIGLHPSWFSSCWKPYYLWTFLQKKWEYAIEPFETHCSLWDTYAVPIERDPLRPGYVIVHYSDFVDDIITKKKLALVKK